MYPSEDQKKLTTYAEIGTPKESPESTQQLSSQFFEKLDNISKMLQQNVTANTKIAEKINNLPNISGNSFLPFPVAGDIPSCKPTFRTIIRRRLNDPIQTTFQAMIARNLKHLLSQRIFPLKPTLLDVLKVYFSLEPLIDTSVFNDTLIVTLEKYFAISQKCSPEEKKLEFCLAVALTNMKQSLKEPKDVLESCQFLESFTLPDDSFLRASGYEVLAGSYFIAGNHDKFRSFLQELRKIHSLEHSHQQFALSLSRLWNITKDDGLLKEASAHLEYQELTPSCSPVDESIVIEFAHNLCKSNLQHADPFNLPGFDEAEQVLLGIETEYSKHVHFRLVMFRVAWMLGGLFTSLENDKPILASKKKLESLLNMIPRSSSDGDPAWNLARAEIFFTQFLLHDPKSDTPNMDLILTGLGELKLATERVHPALLIRSVNALMDAYLYAKQVDQLPESKLKIFLKNAREIFHTILELPRIGCVYSIESDCKLFEVFKGPILQLTKYSDTMLDLSEFLIRDDQNFTDKDIPTTTGTDVARQLLIEFTEKVEKRLNCNVCNLDQSDLEHTPINGVWSRLTDAYVRLYEIARDGEKEKYEKKIKEIEQKEWEAFPAGIPLDSDSDQDVSAGMEKH